MFGVDHYIKNNDNKHLMVDYTIFGVVIKIV